MVPQRISNTVTYIATLQAKQRSLAVSQALDGRKKNCFFLPFLFVGARAGRKLWA